MSTPSRNNNEPRRILIAVDASENSRRAVRYVADLLGGLPGFRITLHSLIADPGDEFFPTEKERLNWLSAKQKEMELILEEMQRVCVDAGFNEQDVVQSLRVTQCTSVAESLIKAATTAGACTLVVGRRGISEKEEFLYGSTSSRILHEARDCAVWVVE